ncbi:MAG: DUF4870 domain-containing protein [Bacteroidales bacterium]|nr:DUF4870 domain-containing protein [Bacteroidales bacterium]
MEENRVLTETERNWAMFCHLAAFAGFFFPFGGIIGPLVCWLTKKDESVWVYINGRNALNFQLSILLYIVLTIPLCFIIIGFPILALLWTLKVICIIIASVKASKGEQFKYPLVIPFIS